MMRKDGEEASNLRNSNYIVYGKNQLHKYFRGYCFEPLLIKRYAKVYNLKPNQTKSFLL